MESILIVMVDLAETLFRALFGQWGNDMTTLLIFMITDFLTSTVIVRFLQPNSKAKALKCKTGWKGICKKCMLFIFIMAAHRLDLLISTKYIRKIVVIAFIINELLSVIENAEMMGIRVPRIFKNTIGILREKISGASTERQNTSHPGQKSSA